MAKYKISKVIKRDGRVVPFDKDRIENAIWKALSSVGVGTREMAAKLANEVVEILEEEFGEEKIPHVEEIQDIVEKVLVNNGLYEVAKAYILYRQQRSEIREIKKMFGVVDDMKLSVNAITVLKNRYLLKDEQGNIVETPKQMLLRVARYVGLVDIFYYDEIYDKEGKQPKREAEEPTYKLKKAQISEYDFEMLKRLYNRLAKEGKMKVSFNELLQILDEKWEKLYEEVIDTFYQIMVNRYFLPNSPTLMNAGAPLGQLSACFVIPIDDSIESIFDALKYAALIHKSGGGTGFSFSRLRPEGDIVRTTKGVASGPVSFMRIFDVATDVIKQGGKRRGANMGILRVDHPDILDFVYAKTKEGMLTNFNISVAVTDEFMEAVEEGRDIDLINPRTGQPQGKMNARYLFDMMVYNAWRTGDPGIIFIDRINKHNPTPHLGKIESTNPCVAGDTLVLTEKGLIPIRELTKNNPTSLSTSLIIDMRAIQGEGIVKSKPLRYVFTGIKPVYRLLTKEGYEIKATLDHRFLTPSGWKKLENLKEGDVLLIQSRGEFPKSRDLPIKDQIDELNEFTKRKTLNLPKEWSEELGFVIGILIGDGWLRKDRVGFSFSSEKYSLLRKVRKIISKWYGYVKPIKRENNTYHLSYHAKGFIEFFRRLGIGIWKAKTKKVPWCIFRAPEDAVKGFLKGLFTSDGSVQGKAEKGVSIRLASTSLRLLKDVQLLLLNFGIKSKIYERRKQKQKPFVYVDSKGREKRYIGGDFYELVISRDSKDKFMEKIGFEDKQKLAEFYKRAPTKSYKDRFEAVVKKIEYIGKQPVYDVTEPLTHTFIANGFIVHNCGEQPLLPFESCNLGSINLSLMVKRKKDGSYEVDWKKLREVVRVAVHFLDNVIDANNYPLPQVEERTLLTRKIGLGVMGWAELLFKLKIPYDSEEALNLARRVMEYINYYSKVESINLARERGSFPAFKGSIYDGDYPRFPFEADDEEKHLTLNWDKLREKIKKYGIRNATTTTIAPTGTISIIAGTSSGIEPLFALAFFRRVLGGVSLFEINPVFEEVLRERGLYSEELIHEVARVGSVQHIDKIPEDIKRIFVTALDIDVDWHVKMQAVFQEFTDNAVSKTINLRYESSPEDVREAFILAYKLKCKGITIYRYGSKGEQVLYVGKPATKEKSKGIIELGPEDTGSCPKGVCKI